jgi:hypothetical protein
LWFLLLPILIESHRDFIFQFFKNLYVGVVAAFAMMILPPAGDEERRESEVELARVSPKFWAQLFSISFWSMVPEYADVTLLRKLASLFPEAIDLIRGVSYGFECLELDYLRYCYVLLAFNMVKTRFPNATDYLLAEMLSDLYGFDGSLLPLERVVFTIWVDRAGCIYSYDTGSCVSHTLRVKPAAAHDLLERLSRMDLVLEVPPPVACTLDDDNLDECRYDEVDYSHHGPLDSNPPDIGHVDSVLPTVVPVISPTDPDLSTGTVLIDHLSKQSLVFQKNENCIVYLRSPRECAVQIFKASRRLIDANKNWTFHSNTLFLAVEPNWCRVYGWANELNTCRLGVHTFLDVSWTSPRISRLGN